MMKRDKKGRFVSEKTDKTETVFKTGFKGFGKGLICRGKQYAENTVFEESDAVMCEKGMHFCENPFDVLEYYPLLNENCEQNEFAAVEALSEPKTEGNKSVVKKIRIGAKLGIAGFCKASFEYLKNICEVKKEDSQSGYGSQQSQSGDYSQQSQSGYGSKQASVGNNSMAFSSGEDSLVAVLGQNGRVNGAMGCVLVLAEYKESDSREGTFVVDRVVSAKVDGKKIKADTWYRLENGKFVEVNR